MKMLALCLMLGIGMFWLGRISAVVDPPVVVFPSDIGDSCISGATPISSTITSSLIPGQKYWIYMATFDPKKAVERSKQ